MKITAEKGDKSLPIKIVVKTGFTGDGILNVIIGVSILILVGTVAHVIEREGGPSQIGFILRGFGTGVFALLAQRILKEINKNKKIRLVEKKEEVKDLIAALTEELENMNKYNEYNFYADYRKARAAEIQNKISQSQIDTTKN